MTRLLSDSMLKKSAFLVVLAIVPMACQKVTIGAIYNGMSTPITITYAMRVGRNSVDGSTFCALDGDSSQWPRLQYGKVTGSTGGIKGWVDIENYRSTENPCEAQFQLEPGYSARVFMNYSCSDYKKYLNGARPESMFAYLRVQSEDGVVEFTDWETAKQFRRVNSNLCLFEIR